MSNLNRTDRRNFNFMGWKFSRADPTSRIFRRCVTNKLPKYSLQEVTGGVRIKAPRHKTEYYVEKLGFSGSWS
jgi:hypothetical protein